MSVKFQVEGMSCEHCVAAITRAIREHDDAAQVQVELTSGSVVVDSTQSVAELKAAIEEAGYTVKEAPDATTSPAAGNTVR